MFEKSENLEALAKTVMSENTDLKHLDNPTLRIVYMYCDKDGKTVCICPRCKKKCSKQCRPEVVERDKFRGWEDCFKVDSEDNNHTRHLR